MGGFMLDFGEDPVEEKEKPKAEVKTVKVPKKLLHLKYD